MSTDMSAPSMRKKSLARNSKPSVKMCIREQREVITMSSAEVCWPVPMRAIGAQNLLTMPGGVSTAGYLHKKGGSQFSLMKWPLRYTIIHKGCVYYFKTSTSPAPQGAFSLNGYNRVMRAAEETTSSNVFPFKIVHFSKKHRTWFFSAASEDERRKWMRYLRREIDHYNDRKESNIPSDPDSDADSFYGTIEKPMDIKHPVDNTEDDYVDDDDEEDEEDYLKPDQDCSPTSTIGRPTGPPPSYPPPPVPSPAPMPLHRNPTSALPPKPLSSILKDKKDSKAPPPPVPEHLHTSFFSAPPLPPPANSKRQLKTRATVMGGGAEFRTERRNPTALSIQSPATLPVCEQLESRLSLNNPNHGLRNPGWGQSLGSNHHSVISNLRGKPSPPSPPTANSPDSTLKTTRSSSIPVSEVSPSHLPLSIHPPVFPPPKPGPHTKPGIPKPILPNFKPQPPVAKPRYQPPESPLQRASPDGQSFRSLVDETAAEFKWKPDAGKCSKDDEIDDDDYENMLLPDSVFIDTTETSFIERLYRESSASPHDGLYCIRKSGTKTTRVLVVWDVSICKARNYRLFEEADTIFLDSEVTFPTLAALIEHYHSHPLPHHGSLCLQKPYTKAI